MSTILNYQQSHLNLNKIESINKGQLVDLINGFIITYLDKLKSLMVNVDSRLFKLNSEIITCQSNLCILEHRISSIPGLELNLDDLKDTKKQVDPKKHDQNNSKQLDSDKQDNKDEDYDNQEEDKDISNDNPELIKFKKMLSVGVPLEAVKMKMKIEGFDPNLLR